MLSNVVLGLLMALGPQTLYSLRRAFEGRAAMLYTGSPGSLQHALRTLADAGLVSVEEVTEQGRHKKVHTVTADGVRSFHSWLRGPLEEGDLELAVLTRIFHLGLIEESEERAAVLDSMVEAIGQALAELDQVADVVANVPGAESPVHRYQVATLDYGRAAHRTGLEFIRSLADAERRGVH